MLALRPLVLSLFPPRACNGPGPIARTERLPQRVRTVAGAVVVLFAYGCWALVSGVGSFLSILAIDTGGPWATACIVWFAGVASWNHYLFRPPRYHGSNN